MAVALGILAAGGGCVNHGPGSAARFSEAVDLRRVAESTEIPPSKIARFGDIEIRSQASSDDLFGRMKAVAVSMYDFAEDPTVFELVLEGEFLPNGSATVEEWNRQKGLPLWIELRSTADTLLYSWPVRELMVNCEDIALFLTSKHFVDIEYFGPTANVRLIVRPHKWQQCLPQALDQQMR